MSIHPYTCTHTDTSVHTPTHTRTHATVPNTRLQWWVNTERDRSMLYIYEHIYMNIYICCVCMCVWHMRRIQISCNSWKVKCHITMEFHRGESTTSVYVVNNQLLTVTQVSINLNFTGWCNEVSAVRGTEECEIQRFRVRWRPTTVPGLGDRLNQTLGVSLSHAVSLIIICFTNKYL